MTHQSNHRQGYKKKINTHTKNKIIWPPTLIFSTILLVSLTLNGWWMNSSSSFFPPVPPSSSDDDDEELSILLLDLEDILLQKSSLRRENNKTLQTFLRVSTKKLAKKINISHECIFCWNLINKTISSEKWLSRLISSLYNNERKQ